MPQIIEKTSIYEKAKNYNGKLCQEKCSSGLCNNILIEELVEYWLIDIKNIMRPSSYAKYKNYAKKYIIPYIGYIQADMFNAAMLSEMLGSLYTDNGGKEEPLSQYTVYLLESMVRSMFRYGAEKKLVPEVLFGRAEFAHMDKKEAMPLSEIEMQQLLYITEKQGEDFQIQVCLPLYTGITLSELCGLKWEDISLETGEINIHRNLIRIQHDISENGRDSIEAATIMAEAELPENMCRKFAMPEKLCRLLKRTAYAKKPLAGNYVAELIKKAGRKKGVYIPADAPDSRTLQYRLKAVGKKAGIKDLTFKMLRDTFVVLCLQAGGDVYSIAYVTGTGITALCDRYRHWMVRNDGFLKRIGQRDWTDI